MNHRSIPPRLGHPAVSLSTEVGTSEPSRPHASALPLRSLRRSLSRLPFRRSAWCSAPSLPPFRFRLFAFAPSLRVRLATFPKCPLRAAARRPHLVCGGFCHGSYSFSTAHPHVSEYEKREASPPPFGDVKPTLPSRAQRFRAWTNPTPVQLPSPAGKRSARIACARLRPEPRHHHAEEPESRSDGGRHRE